MPKSRRGCRPCSTSGDIPVKTHEQTVKMWLQNYFAEAPKAPVRIIKGERYIISSPEFSQEFNTWKAQRDNAEIFLKQYSEEP